MKTKITLETKIKKGDKINIFNNVENVLEVLGDVYFISYPGQHNSVSPFTKDDLVFNNSEILTPEWSAEGLKEGDSYIYICDYGNIVSGTWNNTSIDIFRLKMGLIVENEEAGRARIKEIMEK